MIWLGAGVSEALLICVLSFKGGVRSRQFAVLFGVFDRRYFDYTVMVMMVCDDGDVVLFKALCVCIGFLRQNFSHVVLFLTV